jgi:hypothetical protein
MTWRVKTALRRNNLWFKDQEMYLILSVNTSITALMYVSLERARLILFVTKTKDGYALYYGTKGVIN